jgi:hypothetical protein
MIVELTEALLWGKKMSIRKNVLGKLLAKPVEHPPTMMSTNYHSSTPLLPTMPFPDRNNNELSWLIVLCLGTGWGAPRRPWEDDCRHG